MKKQNNNKSIRNRRWTNKFSNMTKHNWLFLITHSSHYFWRLAENSFISSTKINKNGWHNENEMTKPKNERAVCVDGSEKKIIIFLNPTNSTVKTLSSSLRLTLPFVLLFRHVYADSQWASHVWGIRMTAWRTYATCKISNVKMHLHRQHQ